MDIPFKVFIAEYNICKLRAKDEGKNYSPTVLKKEKYC